jgi:hypothetical protein
MYKIQLGQNNLINSIKDCIEAISGQQQDVLTPK